ncbi:MAG TPA: stage II sporulation protein M [Anaerolineae bacterium]|nr:stage II sporulation protein M [Anaerolineae bacterium]
MGKVGICRSILRALRRARLPIVTFAVTYLVAILIGIVLVHIGNDFALSRRDSIIANAQTSSILIAFHKGNRLGAALLDFSANFLSAVANTISGLTLVVPYPVAAYRGWIVGIVSVDSSHVSRLIDLNSALYYVLTVILQLIPYSLAGGAGVNLGLAFLWPRPSYQGEKWLGLPKEAIRDVLRIYILVLPLFFAASLFEFLAN